LHDAAPLYDRPIERGVVSTPVEVSRRLARTVTSSSSSSFCHVEPGTQRQVPRDKTVVVVDVGGVHAPR